MFDLEFVCTTNNEANKYNNYLDLLNTLRSLPISLSRGLQRDEVDAMDEWIGEMVQTIKQKAKEREN